MSGVARCAALNEADSSKFWGNKYPLCPHCGTEYDISDHEAWHLYSEGDHTVNCPDCRMDYTVQSEVEYRFNTDEQEEQP